MKVTYHCLRCEKLMPQLRILAVHADFKKTQLVQADLINGHVLSRAWTNLTSLSK